MKSVTDWRRNIRMRLYRIEITEAAKEDLENIGDYLAFILENPDAAINTIRQIRKKINTLRYYPERNGLETDPELAKIGVRMDYFRNYKICYIVKLEVIYIVRILHKLEDSHIHLHQSLIS